MGQLDIALQSADSRLRSKHGAAYVPWAPLALGLVACVAIGIWYHFAQLALSDTKTIAALISLPMPRAFSTLLPALLAASVAMVVLLTVLTWALYGARALAAFRADRADALLSKKQLRPLAGASAALTVLAYGLAVWLMFMVALSMLWFGGGMVAAKATTDAVATMAVVDDTLPRLIKTAMGIDPKKQGYLVHVAGRDVNIGSSTCSLFCFTLARAMMADSIDCTCNDALAAKLMPAGNVTADISDAYTCSQAPVMCSINAYASSLYKGHMKPALIAVVVAALCALASLALLGATTGRLSAALAADAALSRCNSADADMRVSTGSDDCAGKADQLPRKASGKVCALV